MLENGDYDRVVKIYERVTRPDVNIFLNLSVDAATYVNAAAVKTFLAPWYSSCTKKPFASITLSALDEASGKSFVTRLVYGVVERKITIDKIISDFCKKPKPKVLVIL